MHRQSHGGSDAQANGIRDTVGGVIGLDGEGPQMNFISGCNRVQGRLLAQTVAEIDLDQSPGQFGSVEGYIAELPQKIGQRPDVIHMPVGDDHPPDTIPLGAEIVVIRDDVIHPQHVTLREHHSHIHDENVAPVLEDDHILTDFPQSTQGNDL